jgi:hypothetical protein
MMARPPIENPKTALTQIRQTPEERARWINAAKAQGMTVADFVRDAVEQHIASTKKNRKK